MFLYSFESVYYNTYCIFKLKSLCLIISHLSYRVVIMNLLTKLKEVIVLLYSAGLEEFSPIFTEKAFISGVVSKSR